MIQHTPHAFATAEYCITPTSRLMPFCEVFGLYDHNRDLILSLYQEMQTMLHGQEDLENHEFMSVGLQPATPSVECGILLEALERVLDRNATQFGESGRVTDLLSSNTMVIITRYINTNLGTQYVRLEHYVSDGIVDDEDGMNFDRVGGLWFKDIGSSEALPTPLVNKEEISGSEWSRSYTTYIGK